MPNILVYEDALVDQLFPITTGRCACSITVATYCLRTLLERLAGTRTAFVRPHLRRLMELDHPTWNQRLGDESMTLIVNARIVPSITNLHRIDEAIRSTAGFVERDGNAVVCALIPTDQLQSIDLLTSPKVFSDAIAQKCDSLPESSLSMTTLKFPHDVVAENLQIFNENLNDRIARGEYREISDGVFVAESAKISDFVVTNTRSGPILIEEDTVIGPFCYLRGPVYLGPNSRINEHAAIKDAVCVGHTVKVGGEVEGSIIESYSNKQHHGFLGHSYLGNWINLGAGTCNSDLKNTYGEVKMEYGGRKVSTGMQFVGCFIGDYSKTAINTSIFTGKVIGVCSMLYGFVTTNVPSFVNYARAFGQITESPAAVMEATQQRMFERRNVVQREADIQLLYDMYELTRSERQMSEEPLAL
ncbi:MAG: putative sugar nucleotidyl transferase [Pirellulaceae bacterium]